MTSHRHKTNYKQLNEQDHYYDARSRIINRYSKSALNEHNKKEENVELSLEVEMDDSVKDIIYSPEKGKSALLDVTVIKPKELSMLRNQEKYIFFQKKKNIQPDGDKFKPILKNDSNKKYLNEKPSEDRPEYNRLSKLLPLKSKFSSNSPLRDETSSNSMITTHLDNLKSCDTFCNELFYKTSDNKYRLAEGNYEDFRPIKNNNVHHIYSAAKTHVDLKSMFTCKHKKQIENEDMKMIKPCLCENCAVVDVLLESQKHPYSDIQFKEVKRNLKGKESSLIKTRKNVRIKESKNLNDVEATDTNYPIYLKDLNERMNKLEKRLAIQEEKAVPKDYFKRIVTRLVTHLSKLTGRHQENEQSCFDSANNPYATEYQVNAAFVYGKDLAEETRSKERIQDQPKRYLWKWGGEILKPGIDLKNKIVLLIEDKFRSFRNNELNPSMSKYDNIPEKEPINKKGTRQKIQFKSDSKYQEIKNCDGMTFSRISEENIPPKQVQQDSYYKYKFKCENSKQRCSTPTEIPSLTESARKSSSDTDLLRRKQEEQSHQVTLERHTQAKNPHSGQKLYRPSFISRKQLRKCLITDYNNAKIDVAYVNPQVSSWPDESQSSFKVKLSGVDSGVKRTMEINKINFMNTIANTNYLVKQKLWTTIWNQAKANGQTKNDKVTIQIPNIHHNEFKSAEIQFTIAELEAILN